jgi:NAD(P)-dependent dehydrogenase (short-subunit alcohol dehydrogenase family)
MTPLSDQVAVVTGAGSGIGKAIALALGIKGATLALVGRRIAPLESVVELARGAGVVAQAFPTDLASADEVRELGARIKGELGQADVLVHCAAIVHMGTVAEASAEVFDQHYQTNLRGPYLLTQALLPLLQLRQGQIVFMNSSAGLAARANVAQYAASKHALKAIADSLREEVNRDGIRVLSVFPGRTATPTQEHLHVLEGRPYHPERLLQPEEVAEVVVHALCLPRTAEVTEIKIRPMLKWD